MVHINIASLTPTEQPYQVINNIFLHFVKSQLQLALAWISLSPATSCVSRLVSCDIQILIRLGASAALVVDAEDRDLRKVKKEIRTKIQLNFKIFLPSLTYSGSDYETNLLVETTDTLRPCLA